jgi:hypothetical protein
MKTAIDRPEIGQWYTRTDKGELFQVVAYDGQAGKIEIQSFDGDLDEIDGELWNSLAPERAAPPENWTGPVDDVETDDLGYSETDMRPSDWTQPLQPTKVEPESGEDTEPLPEAGREDEDEGGPVEPYSAEIPEADERGR